MGYFGGYGAGRGWHKFYFFLLPEELRDVLAETAASLIISNRRVPIDYYQTPLENYISGYTSYFNALLGRNGAPDWQTTGEAEMGITNKLDIVVFEQIEQYPEFKRVNFSEPVVSFSPYPLLYLDGKISLIHGITRYECCFGIEMDFPKVVSYSAEGHEYLYETSDMTNFELFNTLKALIKQRTRSIKVQSPTNIHRVPVQMSHGVREIINDHPGLLNQGLRVISG